MADIAPASLAALEAYAAPHGGRLVCRYTGSVTDGFARANVYVESEATGATALVARGVPVEGNAQQAQALGDYARLFPEPLTVVGD